MVLIEMVMSGFKDGGGVIVPGYLHFTDMTRGNQRSLL
jgi:hypothetical protein